MQTWPFSGQWLCELLLHKHDLQTSGESRVMLLLLVPDFLLPRVEGSFCSFGEEPVLILIWSVNPSAGRIQNFVKILLTHPFFRCLVYFGVFSM